MADAKLRFTEAFKKPLPALYSTVVQELLVQQHLFRWNKGYKYTEVRSKQIMYKFHSAHGSQGSRIRAASPARNSAVSQRSWPAAGPQPALAAQASIPSVLLHNLPFACFRALHARACAPSTTPTSTPCQPWC